MAVRALQTIPGKDSPGYGAGAQWLSRSGRNRCDKLMQAEKAMADKDYKIARRLSEEAEVDARVAETRADAAQNANNLKQVQDSIRTLQEEINRRSPR